MTKIELVDILPTEQEIINYGKYISSLKVESDGGSSYEAQYNISDEELTKKTLNKYHKCCQDNDIDGDYLLASLITAKTFEMNKGGDNV